MIGAARTAPPPALAVVGLVAAGAALGAAAAVEPARLLLVLGLAVAAVVCTARPDAVVPTVVFLIYLNMPAVLTRDHGLPVAAGVLVPLLLVVPIAFRLHRGERLVLDRTLGILLVYLAVQAISAGLSAQPEVASKALRTFVLEGLVVYFLVTNAVRTTAHLRRAALAIVAAASVLAALTIVQSATGSFMRTYGGFALVDPSYYYGHTGSPRASGSIGDPNYYGQVLLAALALALPVWRRERGRSRGAVAAAAVLIAIAITLTSSRGTAVGFAVVLALVFFLRALSRRHMLAIAVGISALLILFPGYRSRVESVVHLGSPTAAAGASDAADESVRGRATEMLASARVFADHPVLGVGPKEFPAYYQSYAAGIGGEIHQSVRYGAERGEPEERVSHDMFLTIAAELGIAGLLAFAAIVLQTIGGLVAARRRLIHDRPDLAALAGGLLLAVVAYLVTGVFLTLAYERYFWLLIALAGTAVRLSRVAETAGPGRVR